VTRIRPEQRRTVDGHAEGRALPAGQRDFVAAPAVDAPNGPVAGAGEIDEVRVHGDAARRRLVGGERAQGRATDVRRHGVARSLRGREKGFAAVDHELREITHALGRHHLTGTARALTARATNNAATTMIVVVEQILLAAVARIIIAIAEPE